MSGGTVLFVTWDGGGNVNPVLALGAELTARGRDVHVLGTASIAPRVEAAGLTCSPRDPARDWDQQATFDDTTAAIDRLAPDVVVVDYMQPAALAASESSAAPTVALVHTLFGSLLVDGDLPPMWMAATVDAVNDLGAPPIARMTDLLDRADRVLVTSPRGLDATGAPPHVRYVGPVLEDAGPDAGWTPPPGDDPLVVVALGTTPMEEGRVLDHVLDALAGEHVRVAGFVGEHIDPASVAAPANATVTGYVRHAAVLPHASAVVCHAGLGTVLAALAHGLPLVCLPLGREQPNNAAAVLRVGAGHALDPTATRQEIRASVLHLLDDERARAGASAMAAEIAATRGAAVREVEALL